MQIASHAIRPSSLILTPTAAHMMGLKQKFKADRPSSDVDRTGKDLENPPDGVQVDAVFGEIDGEGPNYRSVSGQAAQSCQCPGGEPC